VTKFEISTIMLQYLIVNYATDLPTKEAAKKARPRFSKTYAKQKWPNCIVPKKGKRPKAPDCLMGKLILLKTDKDFSLFRTGKSYQTRLLKIRVAFANQNQPRFGFIVPKKVLPKAVDRNLVKRRLKSILSGFDSQLKPLNVLIFPFAGAIKISFGDLKKEVENLFLKAKIWK